MKTFKSGNFARTVAFFLIAVAVICTIGFAANGWQSFTNDGNNSGDVDSSGSNNSDNTDDNTQNNNSDEPTVYIPKYVDYLTGLETSEAEYYTRPTVFVMNSSNPLYGISSSLMTVELPTEAQDTRLMVYMNSTVLPGKIGSLAPTRKYIDNIAKYFGGILVSYGNDDSMSYDGFNISSTRFDLSGKTGYHYTEYTHFVYTNGDLIDAGISSNGIVTYSNQKASIPFAFADFGKQAVLGTVSAAKIILPYSTSSETKLTYSEENQRYTLSKSQQPKKDLLNDKAAEYDNVFVLFADATTYETQAASEMILDTVSGGVGIYANKGYAKEIRWSVDTEGNMLFTDELGEKLTVNRGTSYIGFMKSSRIKDVTIS